MSRSGSLYSLVELMGPRTPQQRHAATIFERKKTCFVNCLRPREWKTGFPLVKSSSCFLSWTVNALTFSFYTTHKTSPLTFKPILYFYSFRISCVRLRRISRCIFFDVNLLTTSSESEFQQSGGAPADWQPRACQVTRWWLCRSWHAAALGCPASYHFPSTPLFSERPGAFSSFSTSTRFIVNSEVSPAAAVCHLEQHESLTFFRIVRLSGIIIWHGARRFSYRQLTVWVTGK